MIHDGGEGEKDAIIASTYRKIFSVHSWLGLFVGIGYLVHASSGAVTVFRQDIEDRFVDTCEVFPGTPRLSYTELFGVLQNDFPASSFISIKVGRHNDATQALVVLTDEPDSTVSLFSTPSHSIVVYVNPYTGTVLRKFYRFGSGTFWSWLDGFHSSFQLGDGGAFLAAVVALLLLCSIVTGFIVYSSDILKVVLFRVPLKFKNWRSASPNLHRFVGVWALAVNVVMFLTASYMSTDFFTPSFWRERTLRREIKQAVVGVPLESLMTAARGVLPDMRITAITINRTADKPNCEISGAVPTSNFLYEPDENSSVAFDTRTGRVAAVKDIRKQDLSTKLEQMNYELHVGRFGGIATKIFYSIFGFAPALLCITGFVIWRRRT